MAEHIVNVDLPAVEVNKKDLIVNVRADDRKLGTLTVSRGGIGWYSFRDQQERHFSWEQFDRLVKSEFGEQ
jgi:hypothetical protein